MQRVNPRTHTPIPATLLVLAIGVILMIVLPGAALEYEAGDPDVFVETLRDECATGHCCLLPHGGESGPTAAPSRRCLVVRRQIVYARTTTVWGRPGSIDDGIASIRGSVMPELQKMHGFIGLSLLADRESGRCIATSAWQSEDDMHASGPLIREVRDRAAQTLGGAPEIAEWEIAVMHREHECADGACVRVGWAKVDPPRIDSGVGLFKDSVLPAFDELEGYCSASLMVNRQTGLVVVSTAFDSADALHRTMGKLDTLRDDTVSEAGAEMLEECDFELAIAHLRVPELV